MEKGTTTQNTAASEGTMGQNMKKAIAKLEKLQDEFTMMITAPEGTVDVATLEAKQTEVRAQQNIVPWAYSV